MFQTLLQLKNNGTLKNLVLSGLMSPKVFTYLEIYMWVDARIKTSKRNIKEIVTEAELNFGVSRATVWRSIKTIKEMNN